MKNIKLLITIITCGLLLIDALSAQGITGKGIKGGLNMAKFTGDDADLDDAGDPKYAIAYSVGGYVTFKLNDQISVQPEVLYTAKGSKYEISEDYSEDGYSMKTDMKMNFSMNYLEIPVLGVFNLQDNIKVFGGPYLGLFLNGETKMEGEMSMTFNGETETESLSETDEIDKEDINSMGFGIVFGGVYLLNNNIGVEARYTLDMNTIDKEPDDWNSSEDGEYEVSDIKNTGLQILLTYSF